MNKKDVNQSKTKYEYFSVLATSPKLLLVDADSQKEICYSSVEMNTTIDEKCSGRKLLATDFPHIKNVRTSEYFIEGYTIYTLNIHFGWYQMAI